MDLPKSIASFSLSWFRKEDWPRWCAIDPDFQPDYQHWLRRMEAEIVRIEQAGHRVTKVLIDPAEFLEWSRVNGGKVDTKARAAFAAYKAMRKHTDH